MTKSPVVPVAIYLNDRIISTHALLDSGSSGNFISASLVSMYTIPVVSKRSPEELRLATGTLSAHLVSQETTSLDFAIGNHKESLIFDVTHLAFPVILGLPWFQHHNPQMNWTQGLVCFNSPHCLKSCEISSPFCVSWTSDASKSRLYSLENVHTQGLNVVKESSSDTTGPILGLETSLNVTSKQPANGLPEVYASYSDVFSKQEADILPQERPYDCAIDLKDPNAVPPFKPIYPLTKPEQHELWKYIQENLKKGFIRPSKSPAGAPIFFVKKKDGTLRPCIDYRGLNAMTVKNRYPLPLISVMLDQLKGSKIFTKIDLRGAYNLLRMRQGDEWKTAFRTIFGHYEYLVMPFGLTNAPAIFQFLMNDIFRDYLDRFVVIYLDDILIFSPDESTHQEHVKLVLERLRQHKLYGKLEKSFFHKDSVEFLGYIVSANGISMSPDKVSSILSWPTPKTLTQLQAFLGFANFYRRFIKNYSMLVKPLTDLTRKTTGGFVWSENSSTAFEALKSALSSAPTVLAHPDPDQPFTVQCDASNFAIGAILSQRSSTDNDLHPVAFYSRKLIPAEINYHAGEKELLAIVSAFQHWRHYLLGAQHPVTVLSDHSNLKAFTSKRILSHRLARWAQILSDFDFVIKHVPGSSNTCADALSRRSDYVPSGEEKASRPQEFVIRPEQLISTISSGPSIHQRTITDPSERLAITQARHDSPSAGHFGISKTCELILRHFWWPGLRSYVKKFVKSCDVCQRNKAPRHLPFGLLQPLPLVETPWSSISMDLIVKLPKSNGCDSILVVVCRFTKMAHFIACNETLTGSQAAELFLKEIYRLHGLPKDIVTDRGPQFRSTFWRKLMSLLDVKTNLSSAFHPQSDGQTERVNQVLEQYLRCFINYNQDNWFELLPFAEFAYNNAQHSATQFSPFFTLYGYHPKADTLEGKNLSASDSSCTVPAVVNRIERLKDVHRQIKDHLSRAQESAQKYSNASRIPHDFKVNDKVWLLSKNVETSRPTSKLDHRRLGPFKIIEKINAVAYKLQLPASVKIHPVFHVSLLEPYHENRIPGRIMPVPPTIKVQGAEEYEVSKVLDSRIRHGKLEYLVDWKGYTPDERSWEPAEHLANAKVLVKQFHNKYPSKPRAVQRPA